MLNQLKSSLSRMITNSQGWKTNEKIIIFESDDWGSVRMPNKAVQNAFKEKGYDVISNPYCKFDTLANSDDLNSLFKVLRKHKDKDGNHAMITANTVVANPIFSDIRASNFSDYNYEPFTETLKDYYPKEDVFSLWQEGIDDNIFFPQFHGREHVNVPLWLELLRNNNKAITDAFDLKFWGVPEIFYPSNIQNLQAAFGSVKPNDVEFYRKSLVEGLNLFEKIFNFKSETFIANNYTWSDPLNNTLYENGIIGLQGMKYQKVPLSDGCGIKLRPKFTGKINELGQVYMVRNCVFEPSQMSKNFNNVDNCLSNITNAFFFNKPAIITSHRLNFIGVLSKENRDLNLLMLDKLIKTILEKWPDVIFMTSNKLAQKLHQK